MQNYDKRILSKQAKELGFIRDTFEKVCRLSDVLSFIQSDPLLGENLALKGGSKRFIRHQQHAALRVI